MRFVILLLLFTTSITARSFTIAKSGLFLRAEPNIHSEKLFLIPYMSRVEILEPKVKTDTVGGEQGYWQRIKVRQVGSDNEVKELSGYGFSKYIQDFSLLPDKIKNSLSGQYYSYNLANSLNYIDLKLSLHSDNSFEMTINLCEGYGKYTGMWKYSNQSIVLYSLKRDFHGFSIENENSFIFKVIRGPDTKLRMVNSDLACVGNGEIVRYQIGVDNM